MQTAKKLLAPLLALTPIATALPARADVTPEERDIAFLTHALVIRPDGTFVTVGGFALFLLTLPFAILANSVEKSYTTLVVNPATHTPTRRSRK